MSSVITTFGRLTRRTHSITGSIRSTSMFSIPSSTLPASSDSRQIASTNAASSSGDGLRCSKWMTRIRAPTSRANRSVAPATASWASRFARSRRSRLLGLWSEYQNSCRPKSVSAARSMSGCSCPPKIMPVPSMLISTAS